MTPEQLRMARAKLDLSQDMVAEHTGIAQKTLARAEGGKTDTSHEILSRLQSFYEDRGLEFTENNGVREKPFGNRIYKGKAGFRDFYEYHWGIIRRFGGELWLYNGVSKLIIDALGADYIEMHKARMSEIKHRIQYRVIVEEGDATFFGSDYAHYRWISKETFNDKTIFVFGPCVAFVTFDGNLTVTVIEQKDIADTLRNLMKNSWDQAWEPS